MNSVMHGGVKVECMDAFDDPAKAFVAANDRGYRAAFKQGRLIFNATQLGASDLTSTVGHELLHFFANHERNLDAVTTLDQERDSDRVYACEALCFGSRPTMCDLAACQGKTLSTWWVGKSCAGTVRSSDVAAVMAARGDGVKVEPCASGQNIGALCVDSSGAQFCNTLAECNAACGAGGKCTSYSVSCLDSCR